jgi:UDP-2-acetamido-3-amino-2,3-dideoxy-glucuronate N-acetyltransferase
MAGARIGARCVLGQNVFVASRAVIGDGCKIQNNVSLYDDVVLEADVFVAPSAVFTNVNNPRAFIERKHEYRTTLVKRGASIGANATVVCGHTIGEYAFIGAGAVVTKDVPAYALVLGVPGSVVGWMCRCGVRLPSEQAPTCSSCGLKYQARPGCRWGRHSDARGHVKVPLLDVKAQNAPLREAILAPSRAWWTAAPSFWDPRSRPSRKSWRPLWEPAGRWGCRREPMPCWWR